MAVFNGTGGNDSLIGTDEDDIFNESSLGQDVLVGGGGYDTAIIDYSGIGQQAVGGSIGYSSGGLHSMIQSADQSILVDTYEIEKLDIKTGSLNNGFQIDLSQVFGWSISVDAGGGQDYLSLTMYYDSPALVGNVTSGFTSGNLTIKNFEQFYLNLGMGNDHLTLGSGHDTVKANAGDDYIDGGDGNDLLEGNLGGDTLIGGAGDDGVYAWDSYSFTDDGSERDILSGGAGNDTVSAGYGDDADGGTGTDVLSLSMQGGPSGAVLDLSAVFAGGTVVVGGGTIKGFESYGNIYGTNFDDTITTGNAAAIGSLLNRGVFGYGGNDTITTGIYEDSVHGMEGNDVIRSGGGNDRASGGDGNDQVYGEAGNDTLWGGDGDDLVQGADGNDNILGGFGADQIGDYNGDGRDDILWRHDNGTIINWLGTASGGFTDNSANLFTSIALAWQVAPADALI